MSIAELNRTLRRTSRARLAVELLRAAALAVAVLVAAGLLAVMIDAAFGLDTVALMAGNAALAAVAAVAIAAVVRTAWRHRFNARRIARYIEHRSGDGGSHLINAVEFAEARGGESGGSGGGSEGSAALRAMAIDSGDRYAARVQPTRLIDRAPMGRALLISAMAVAMVLLMVVFVPRLFAMVVPRFLDPAGDHPPFTLIDFDVTVTPQRVYHGHRATIAAGMTGPMLPDEAAVVFVDDAGDAGKASTAAHRLPMIRLDDGRFELPIESATGDRVFYIDTPHGRSRRHTLRVLPVPTFERVRVRYDYPAYTGWPADERPLDEHGVEALVGTRVTVSVDSNLPLSMGALIIRPDTPGSGTASAAERDESTDEATINLPPAAERPTNVAGAFVLTHSGVYELALTARDGTPSDANPTGPMAALADEPPRIQLLDPDLRVIAPVGWKLDVTFALSDDVGVARAVLHLQRNDRSMQPLGLELDRSGPSRATATHAVDLGAMGAEAGDVIKGFATVWDNHPGAPRSADSATFEVRVISKQEYAERARERYRIDDLNRELDEQAAKLAALDAMRKELIEQAEALKAKLEATGGARSEADAAAEQALREKLAEFAEESKALSDELAKRAERDEIYEFEKAALEQMKREAQQLGEQSANADRHAEALQPATPPKLEDLLSDLQRDGDAAASNAQKRESMRADLEKLAKAEAMMAQAGQIIRIAQQQRELADRLGAIRGADPLNPDTIERLGRVADEQAALADELDRVLDALLEAAAAGKDELPQMAASAEELVKTIRLDLNVRLDQMNAVLAARLIDAPDAFTGADRAAAKLESLIEECESQASGEGAMGELDGALGLTKAQLGNAMGQMAQARAGDGRKPGQNQGQGSGDGSGGSSGSQPGDGGSQSGGDANDSTLVGPHAQQRSPSDSVSDGQPGGDAFNRADRQHPAADSADAQRLDPTQRDAARHAPGDVDVSPPRFRSLIDDYFKRLADDSRR